MAKRSPNKAVAKLAGKPRRNRLWPALIAVIVLASAVIIGVGVYYAQQSDNVGTADPKAVAASDHSGIPVGSGPVTVDLYADFLCPVCKDFEATSGPTLTQLVADKKITLVFHPVSILNDRTSPAGYSERAAAAAACAADHGGKFTEYAAALYAQQPEEGSAGLTNKQLIEIGRGVGLGDDFADCVTDKTFRGWAARVTDTAASRGFTSTPTVVVNGKQLETPTPQAITEAVNAATAK